MSVDLLGYFNKGGWAMWPLLGFSVLALTFTIERMIVLFFQKRKLKPDQFLDEFDKALKKHNGDKEAVTVEMIALCRKKGGVAAEIMLEGLEKYRHARSLNMSVFDMKKWLNEAIEERARIELPQLESHLGIISVVATVAPLLGLLGTVLGMIKSFTVMANAAGGICHDRERFDHSKNRSQKSQKRSDRCNHRYNAQMRFQLGKLYPRTLFDRFVEPLFHIEYRHVQRPGMAILLEPLEHDLGGDAAFFPAERNHFHGNGFLVAIVLFQCFIEFIEKLIGLELSLLKEKHDHTLDSKRKRQHRKSQKRPHRPSALVEITEEINAHTMLL